MPDWMRYFHPTVPKTPAVKQECIDLTKNSPEVDPDTDVKTFFDLRQEQSHQVQTRLEQNILARQEKQQEGLQEEAPSHCTNQ